MMVVVVMLGFALLGVLMSGFYSGSETGLYCVDRLRLRVDAQRGDRRAGRIARLVERDRDALATMLMGTNLANYVVTVLVAHVLAAYAGVSTGASELYTTAIVTPIVFVFGEVVPKTLYHRHGDALMRASSGLLEASTIVLRWPVRAIDRLAHPLVRFVDPKGLSEVSDPRARVAALLQDALATGDRSGEHRAFVDRVLGLSQIAIHQVMVPRNRVTSIRADATRRELEALAARQPHSRILVYERTPRRVSGYVSVHELLADTNWTHVGERSRPVPELAAHDSVATALVRLQREQATLAAVTDRSGFLLGLVTRKDLVEELTGELPEW